MITITDEMAHAIDYIQNTTESVYITGKAGTGKTTFLKHLTSVLNKKYIITAPTGIAAVNAGGITLHSFLNIPFSVLGPDSAETSKYSPAKKMLANIIDVLIIDEISMVRADLLDFVDKKLRIYRDNDMPFGGIQVVMFGDLHQLPPVVRADDRKELAKYYPGPYFFNANVFQKQGFKIFEFTTVFRQSDDKFIQILNNIRNYKLTADDLQALEELRNKQQCENYDGKYIHICSHKADVQKINDNLLGEATHEYKTVLEGDFNPQSMPCDDILRLRVGARVMTLVNDKDHRFYNGSLGIITHLSETEVGVLLDNGIQVKLDKYAWESCEYKVNSENQIEKIVKGSCKQFPLQLAWAITIHKSQGLTFDNIVIHSKSMFCSGQLYVALSRCRTLEGIVSESFITPKMIIPDKELSAFEKAYSSRNNYFDEETYNIMRSC